MGAAQQINGSQNQAFEVSLSYHQAGNHYLVAWANGSGNTIIYARRVQGDGTLLSDVITIYEYPGGDYQGQTASSYDNVQEENIVVWRSWANDQIIHAARIDADGNLVGSIENLVDHGTDAAQPQITYHPTLGYGMLVWWQSDDEIYAQRYFKEQRLINIGDEWRYFKGTQAPPTDWNSLSFDDSTWLSGPTGIGYGDSDDATVLSDMNNGYLTVFARRAFTLTNIPVALQLVLDYDDGFIAYLNGTQVAASQASNTAYDAPADGEHEAGTPVVYDLTPYTHLLQPGPNVLAIQGHNYDVWSTDFSLIPVLQAGLIGDGKPTNFETDTTQGSASLDVTFTNLSDTSYTDWTWDFGDGTTHTENGGNRTITHTYNLPNLYTVTLTLTGTEGSEVVEKRNYIEVLDPSIIRQIIGPDGGTLTSGNGQVLVEFPSGAVTQTIVVTYTDIVTDNVTNTIAPFKMFSLEAALEDVPSQAVTTFNHPITITVPYLDVDFDTKSEDNIYPFYRNQSGGRWHLIRDSWVVTESNDLKLVVDHFTEFGIAALSGPPAPEGATLPSTTNFGSSDMFGTATVNIPIELPPLPGNLSLPLSLNYSSDTINSIRNNAEANDDIDYDDYKTQASVYGLGWNLSGLSSIGRGPVANAFPVPWLNMGGQHWMFYSPTTQGFETQPISFLKIKNSTLENKCSSKSGKSLFNCIADYAWDTGYSDWEVWDQNGTHYIFGETQYHKIGKYKCEEGVSNYFLTDIIDVHGNKAKITYYNDNEPNVRCGDDSEGGNYDRAIYPASIEFSAAGASPSVRVLFGRIKSRGDSSMGNWEKRFFGYDDDKSPRFPHYSKHRVTDIKVEISSNGGVSWDTYRQYDLNVGYVQDQNENNNAHMLLEKVVPHMPSGVLPAQEFNYSHENGVSGHNWNFSRLTEVKNGYGGVVKYTYQDTETNISCGNNDEPNIGRYRLQKMVTYNEATPVSTLNYAGYGTGLCRIDANNPWFFGYPEVTKEAKAGDMGTLINSTTTLYRTHMSGRHLPHNQAGFAYKSTLTADGVIQKVLETTWVDKKIVDAKINLAGWEEVDLYWTRKNKETETLENNSSYQTDYVYNNTTTWPYNYGHPSAMVSNNEVRTETDYIHGATIRGLPKEVRVKDMANEGKLLRRTHFYYDQNPGSLSDVNPTKGFLNTTQSFINASDYVLTKFYYQAGSNPGAGFNSNTYGNQTRIVDANGHEVITEYDPTYHTYVTKVTNDKDYTVITDYYYNLGLIKSETDANNQTTTYNYDSLGRLSRVLMPGDSASNPTLKYSYSNLSGGVINPPYRVTAQQRTDTGYITGRSFYNGLGQLIQNQGESDDNSKVMVINQAYNAQGLVEKTSYLYEAANTGNYHSPSWPSPTIQVYDKLGRPTLTTYPDGTQTRVEYTGWDQKLTDANNHHRDYDYDALGRLENVTEYDAGVPATTNYDYNAVGELFKVTDAAGNETTIAYDMLGRKTGMNDPDMGQWYYYYDDVGNLVAQVDAKKQVTNLYYDSLNRLIVKTYDTTMNPANYPHPSSPVLPYVTEYVYDEGTNANGMTLKGYRTSMLDQAGQVTWEYTNRGQVQFETRLFSDDYDLLDNSVDPDGTDAYTIRYTYDAADRIKSIIYPDGEEVINTFTNRGSLETLNGLSTYINPAAYDMEGRLETITLGNGLQTSYNYYAPNIQGGRLQNIKVDSGSLLNIGYQYDNVGNITQIDEVINTIPVSQKFIYDDLDRLTDADPLTADPNLNYTKDYAYNSMGNITSRDGQNYSYPAPGPGAVRPHAVTAVGSNSYAYDANGNMETRTEDGITYTQHWNEENKLEKVTWTDGGGQDYTTRFVYDGDGNRLLKIENPSAAADNIPGVEITTLYIGKLYEEQFLTTGLVDLAAVDFSSQDNSALAISTIPNTEATPARFAGLASPLLPMLQASSPLVMTNLLNGNVSTVTSSSSADKERSNVSNTPPLEVWITPSLANNYAAHRLSATELLAVDSTPPINPTSVNSGCTDNSGHYSYQLIQDSFNLHGGLNVNAADALTWLKFADLDNDEVWQISGHGTMSRVSSGMLEGDSAIRVDIPGTGGFVSFHLKHEYSAPKDFTADGRWTSDDWIVIPFYLGQSTNRIILALHFKDTSWRTSSFSYAFPPLSAGWHYLALPKGSLDARGMDWSNVNGVGMFSSNFRVNSSGTQAGYVIFDAMHILNREGGSGGDIGPTTYDYFDGKWKRAVSNGSNNSRWHIYDGMRSGEPQKPYAAAQINTATTPSQWYLLHRDLNTEQIHTGLITTGTYFKDNDGTSGLAFSVQDVTANSWDMYAIEADNSANQISLVKWVNGTRTVIQTDNFTLNPNQIVWLGVDTTAYESDNGRIKVYASLTEGNLIQPGNLIMSTQDTALSGGGSVGLLSYQANVRFVDFVADSSNRWQNECNDPDLSWSGVYDIGDGIDGYDVYWGTAENGEDVNNWRDVSNPTFDPPQVTSGETYFLRINTYDLAGNESGWESVFTFKYDGVKPTNPTNAVETNGAITDVWQTSVVQPGFTWSGADGTGSPIAKYHVYWGDDPQGDIAVETVTSAAYTVDTPQTPGTYYLRIQTEDEAGNLSTNWDTLFIFKLEDGPPQLPASAVETTLPSEIFNDLWQNQINTPAFSWSPGATDVSGIDTYELYWGTSVNGPHPGDPATLLTSATDIPANGPYPSGSIYYLNLRAEDNLGNWSDWETLYTFKFDNTKPSITTVSPIDQALLTTSQPTISADFSDAEAGVDLTKTQLLLDGQLITPDSKTTSNMTYTPSSDLSPGIHYITVQVYDEAGNLSQHDSTFTIDPDTWVTISSPTDGTVTNQTDIPLVIDLEPGAALTVKVNGTAIVSNQTINDGQWRGNSGNLPLATNTIEAEVTDLASNQKTASIEVKVDNTADLALVQADPAIFNHTTGSTNFYITALAGTGANVVQWDLTISDPDGQPVEIISGNTPVNNHVELWTDSSLADGLYTYQLSLTLDTGGPINTTPAQLELLSAAPATPPALVCNPDPTWFSIAPALAHGTASADTTAVVLYVDGIAKDVVPVHNGQWQVMLPLIDDSLKTIAVTGQNVAGNESVMSNSCQMGLSRSDPFILPHASLSPATDIGLNTTVTLQAHTRVSGAPVQWVKVDVLTNQFLLTESPSGVWNGSWPTPASGAIEAVVPVAFTTEDDAVPTPNQGGQFVQPYLDFIAPEVKVTWPLDTHAQQSADLTVKGTTEILSIVEIIVTPQGGGTAIVETVSSGTLGQWEIVLTSLPNGTYHLTAQTTDRVGNVGPLVGPYQVTIDNGVPQVTAITPAYVRPTGNTEVAATAIDAEGNLQQVQATIADFPQTGIDKTIDLIASGGDAYNSGLYADASANEGWRRVTVTAWDSAGNTDTLVETNGVLVDATNPIVQNLTLSLNTTPSPTNLYLTGSDTLYYGPNSSGELHLNIEAGDEPLIFPSGLDTVVFPSIFSATDGQSLDYLDGESTVTPYAHDYSVVGTQDVVDNFTIRATDRAGNNSFSNVFRVEKDSTGPTFSNLTLTAVGDPLNLHTNNSNHIFYYGPDATMSDQLDVSIDIEATLPVELHSLTFPDIFATDGTTEDLSGQIGPATLNWSYNLDSSQSLDTSFNINAKDLVGNPSYIAFNVIKDTQKPTSVNVTVPAEASINIVVSWSALDEVMGSGLPGSGIRDYDVYVKKEGEPTWTLWQNKTTDTQATFTGAIGNNYYFQVQAWDNVDNGSDLVSAGPVLVNSSVRKNYFFGNKLVATRQGDALYYVNGDHLGSTSLTTDKDGLVVSEARYLPYGQERWPNNVASPTDFGFTSQRNEKSFGLMDYNARYYSPVLGRFISPDTIVPDPSSSGGFNRYRYVRNNPLNHTDSSGHGCDYCERFKNITTIGINIGITGRYEVGIYDAFINGYRRESGDLPDRVLVGLFDAGKEILTYSDTPTILLRNDGTGGSHNLAFAINFKNLGQGGYFYSYSNSTATVGTVEGGSLSGEVSLFAVTGASRVTAIRGPAHISTFELSGDVFGRGMLIIDVAEARNPERPSRQFIDPRSSQPVHIYSAGFGIGGNVVPNGADGRITISEPQDNYMYGFAIQPDWLIDTRNKIYETLMPD